MSRSQLPGTNFFTLHSQSACHCIGFIDQSEGIGSCNGPKRGQDIVIMTHIAIFYKIHLVHQDFISFNIQPMTMAMNRYIFIAIFVSSFWYQDELKIIEKRPTLKPR